MYSRLCKRLRTGYPNFKLSPEFYDFIIIDEVHHAPANSYRFIFDRFAATVLLGLTATPERMDGEDILKDFCNTIAAEIRLPEAINRKLLSPFQYFAVSDSIDLSQVTWRKGRYDITELCGRIAGSWRWVDGGGIRASVENKIIYTILQTAW